jgi:hypothetical protein
METPTPAPQLPFFNRFIGVCISVITACVIMVTSFIWELKGEFAAQKQKTETISSDQQEMKGQIADHSRTLEVLSVGQAQHDTKIDALQKQIDNHK